MLVYLPATAVFCCAQSASESQPAGQTQANPPAQQSPAAQAADPGQKDHELNKDQEAAKGQPEQSGTSKDRLFFALPNFLTLENAAHTPPLKAGQKFKVVARGAFDPFQFAWYGLLSGISQAENSEPGYGQGMEGYGKRYGAYFADGVIENFMVGAVFPSVLRQDPRYFQSGKGGFFKRTGYAVSRIAVTRSDSGRHEFNSSEVFGSALASAISTYSYHPHPDYHPQPGMNVRYVGSDRTLTNTAGVWVSQMGYDAFTLVLKEFWPDIRKKVKKQAP